MDDKVGTRDLDNNELIDANDDADDADNTDNNDDDPISISSDDDKDETPPTKPSLKKGLVKQEPGLASQGPVARRAASGCLTTPIRPTPRTSRVAPLEFLNTITRSLDPRVQAARDEEWTARSLQTTQLFSLTSQLRDSQATLEDLRNRLSTAERRADHAKLELRVERMTRGHPHDRSPVGRSGHSPTHRHHDRCVRHETRYRSGGGSVTWVTPSDKEEEYFRHGHHNDSDIEWQHYGSPRPIPRPAPSHRHRSASPASHTGSRHARHTSLDEPASTQCTSSIFVPSSQVPSTPSRVSVSATPSCARASGYIYCCFPQPSTSSPPLSTNPRPSGISL